MTARAPEQIIRDWLAENGPTRVGLEAFEQTWGIESMGARDRRRVAAALARAGVRVEPPLARVSRRDKVSLSLEPVAEAPPTVVEPEPEPLAELEPEPEPPPAPPRHDPWRKPWAEPGARARARGGAGAGARARAAARA